MAFRSSTSSRLDEALALIGETRLFERIYRNELRQFVKAHVERTRGGNASFLPVSTAPSNVKHFVAELKTTDEKTVGTPDQRTMRLAMYLLRSAIGDNDPAAYARSVPVGDVQAQFVSTMWKAICAVHEAANVSSGPRAAYKWLRESPLTFLRDSKVQVDGSTQVDANNDTNLVDFVFRYDVQRDKYRFESAAKWQGGVGKYVVSATSVPAIPWSSVPGRGGDPSRGSFRAIRGTHYDRKLMVTTQLTGCAFCTQAFGGTLCSAHLKPGGGLDGTMLARQLAGEVSGVDSGAFSNPPGGQSGKFLVFGRGVGTFPKAVDGYDARLDAGGEGSYATVIGFKPGDVWHLYVQETLKNELKSAREIW